MEKWTRITILITTCLVLNQYTALGDRNRDHQLVPELSKVPPTARDRTNPYAGDQDAYLAGKKLFQRHCSGCHGKDATGGNNAPTLHSPTIREAAPGTLFWFLKNGNLKKGMPSWARLPEQQLWQIVTFLKSKD